MKLLPVNIDESLARDRLTRRSFARLRSLISRAATTVIAPNAQSVKTAHRFELVYLPQYLVTFELKDATTTRLAAVLVGAHEPTATLWDVTHTDWVETTEELEFPPSVDPQLAKQLARRQVNASLRRLMPGAREWPTLDCATIELVGYPYWTYYFHRRARLFDVRLLDAVSGRPAGARLKVALLTALAARRDALGGRARFPLETVVTAL